MGASTLLRAARRSSGLGQSELAARAGTSQPDVSLVEQGRRNPTVETFERLLGGVGHKIFSYPTSSSDAVEIASLIAFAVEEANEEKAFRRFLDYSDGLAAADGVERIILTAAEPADTGSPLWDAALASVASYWLDDQGLPKPAWLSDRSRALHQPQSLGVSVYDLEPDVAFVPSQFLTRNVLVERSTLASV
ncbi:helix-turn-helix domain-containing protein [Subtercola boreus]|nr:helix-turn-helix transcriptional regulator [Subtercola boreus]TQL54014.1 helix-turn-helix protein [Subtercola boreus]